MRKVLVSVLAFVAIMLTSCGGADRAHQLKVLNWADYIDEDVKENFEQWYYEQTGEKVQLVYETFDINETALTKIEVGHEDYDVFCPSEYIIERMLKKNLIQPIQKDLIPDSIYYFDNISPYVIDKFQHRGSLAQAPPMDHYQSRALPPAPAAPPHLHPCRGTPHLQPAWRAVTARGTEFSVRATGCLISVFC